MNKRLVSKLIGQVLLVEAALYLIPIFVSVLYDHSDLKALLISMGLTLAMGGALQLLKPRNENLRAREGLAVVGLSWIFLSAFGALPFWIHGCIPSYLDAFFETVSGFTTTGATILTDVEALPRGLTFWRSFTHWVGGMGVLVLSLALLPKMGARSIYLMRAESPGPSTDKLVPKIGQNAKILYLLYLALSVLMLICLLIAGMNPYDALVHTFGAAGTGGFSNYNASVAAFNSPAIEIIIGVFMALFGVNFSMYYYLLRKNYSVAFKKSELRCYLSLLLGSTLVIAFMIIPNCGGSFLTALRTSFFQVSSIMTTTGYGTADFDAWPQLCRTLLVLIMLVGACAGSTGGGMKVVRVQLLCKSMMRDIKRTLHPKSVVNVRMDGKTVSESIISGVMGFFFAYIFILLLATLIVSIDGFSFETNLTAVIATLSNIGPGLGKVGPTGNFSEFSNLSKIVLSLCMLIGRLEIFPMLMLAIPNAWQRY